MASTYFNNAVLGNSRMLACVSAEGELVRLFWPHIDHEQHIDRHAAGILQKDRGYTIWLHDGRLGHDQSYIAGTNVLRTVCTDTENSFRAIQTDFILPEKDALVRLYELENTGLHPMNAGFAVYSALITSNPDIRSSLYDFDTGQLIHYKHDCYLSISSDLDPVGFQLGGGAFDACGNGMLNGWDSIGMMPEGAVLWDVGNLQPGEVRRFSTVICAAGSIRGVKRLSSEIRSSGHVKLLDDTAAYWKKHLSASAPVRTGRNDLRSLYERTVLLFKLMADEKTGGLLASPEIDEGFTRCGRYAYCWGRDAAFITGALDRCGLHDAAERFYNWACLVQEENGSWQQRHHVDGNLAPSWGLQVDETGTLIWGALQHYEMTGSRTFLEGMWNSIHAAAGFLAGFIDTATGLPKPSFDLWEERFGEHAYSSSAVYAGLVSAARIAGILGIGGTEADEWRKAAANMKEAIIRNFWKPGNDRFIRSIRVKLNPWGPEPHGNTVLIEANPMGYKRDVTLEEWNSDISLLGLAVPFGTFDIFDPMVEMTARHLETVLAAGDAGGLRRYEGDNYIGGNPWVIASLWAALYHIGRREFDIALKYFEWAVGSRSALDLLPEQADPGTGRPVWVVPLAWSHAMFVHVLFGLEEAGIL